MPDESSKFSFIADKYTELGRSDSPGASVAGMFFPAYAALKTRQYRGTISPGMEQWIRSHEAILGASIEAVGQVDPRAGELMREYISDDIAIAARIAHMEGMSHQTRTAFESSCIANFTARLKHLIGPEEFSKLPQPFDRPRPSDPSIDNDGLDL